MCVSVCGVPNIKFVSSNLPLGQLCRDADANINANDHNNTPRTKHDWRGSLACMRVCMCVCGCENRGFLIPTILLWKLGPFVFRFNLI